MKKKPMKGRGEEGEDVRKYITGGLWLVGRVASSFLGAVPAFYESDRGGGVILSNVIFFDFGDHVSATAPRWTVGTLHVVIVPWTAARVTGSCRPVLAALGSSPRPSFLLHMRDGSARKDHSQ